MNKKIYWVLTVLVALALFGGGVGQLSGSEEMQQNMARLGYPAYVLPLLGLWKVGAAVALLVPGFARIKEWAYAGIGFLLTGAFVSHLASGDPVADSIAPLVVLSVAVASYVLRPVSRRLDAANAPSEGPVAKTALA